MQLEDLIPKYDQLQKKYGAKELNAIYNGGDSHQPNICFVFMNPTGKNVGASKTWQGIRSPWLGSKNIWDLFYRLDLLDEPIYQEIKSQKGSKWTEAFAEKVYKNVQEHHYFITNLGKCTQIDARPLPDSVYKNYLNLLEQEIAILDPKVIILFGNQVSSIVLNQKICVSQVRKKQYTKTIFQKDYPCYAVYYPVGNGRFNLDKAVEDITWILHHEFTETVTK